MKLWKSLNGLTCTYKEVSNKHVECQLIPWQSGWTSQVKVNEHEDTLHEIRVTALFTAFADFADLYTAFDAPQQNLLTTIHGYKTG